MPVFARVGAVDAGRFDSDDSRRSQPPDAANAPSSNCRAFSPAAANSSRVSAPIHRCPIVRCSSAIIINACIAAITSTITSSRAITSCRVRAVVATVGKIASPRVGAAISSRAIGVSRKPASSCWRCRFGPIRPNILRWSTAAASCPIRPII